MPIYPDFLNVFFRDRKGKDSQQQLSIFPDCRLRFGWNKGANADPVLSDLDTFPLLPVTSAVTAASDKIYLVTGTNAANADVTQDAAEGGINVATHGSSADQTMLAGIASTRAQNQINAGSRIVFEARVCVNQLTACFGSVGLNENVTDPDPTGTAGEGAMFLFDPTDVGLTTDTGLTAAQHANWVLCHKVNGADTFTATSVPIIAGKDYTLRINIGADLKALFYIDDVLVGTGPALTSGDSVRSFLGIEATAGAVKSFDVRYVLSGRRL